MTLDKRRIDQVDVHGKTVLMRVDFNVPLKDGRIADDRRIALSVESIQSVIRRGGRLILASHLGRPNETGSQPEFSLAPVAERLRQLMPDATLTLAPDCIGDAVENLVLEMNNREVLLLENLRFHHGEKARDSGFAAQLACLAEIYCHESFGTAHRKDASMLAVPEEIGRHGGPRVAGFLLEREINELNAAFAEPRRPFVAVLGGAKVADKLDSIENLLQCTDTVLIGGAMAYTFLLAKDVNVGSSKVEPECLPRARQILEQAAKKKQRLLLPVDHVCGQKMSDKATSRVFDHAIPESWKGLDIGPKTLNQFVGAISNAKTIYWNGPVGAFEYRPFADGTDSLAQVIAMATAQHQATSIIGGGDSGSAIEAAGLSAQMTHISTGGGASLHLLEGHRFSSVDLLDERK